MRTWMDLSKENLILEIGDEYREAKVLTSLRLEPEQLQRIHEFQKRMAVDEQEPKNLSECVRLLIDAGLDSKQR